MTPMVWSIKPWSGGPEHVTVAIGDYDHFLTEEDLAAFDSLLRKLAGKDQYGQPRASFASKSTTLTFVSVPLPWVRP
jgi:hypothetical protein